MPSSRAKPPFQLRRSYQTRATLQHALFALCIVIVLSVIAFIIARGFLEQRVLAQISSIVAAKEDFMERSLQSDRERTALMGSLSEFQSIFLGQSGSPALEKLLENMRQENIPVRSITVWDNSGTQRATTKIAVTPPDSISTKTSLHPVIVDAGWEAYEVYAPIRSSAGVQMGMLGVSYDSRPLVETLLTAPTLGDTGEVLVGMDQDGELVLLLHNFEERFGRPIYLGTTEDQYSYGAPLAQAVRGEENLRRAQDYRGHNVYAAYRNIPSLGWGLVVKVDQAEALHGTRTLALFLALAGLFMAAGAGVIALILARHLTCPILRLSKRMQQLGPDHWNFKRSVHTGDEIELLDHVAADMAQRLSKIYESLEEEVSQRTQELKEQYVKDHAILQSIQHGVIVIDRKGDVVDTNRSALTFLSMSSDSINGKSIQDVLPLICRKKDCKDKNHPAIRSLRTRKVIRADTATHMNIVRADKLLLPINLVVTPLIDGRRVLGAVLVFQDMTDERRTDYLKSEFISLASHQLRTPLSTMQWYLELLGDKKNHNLTVVQREFMQEMQRATDRMTNLVETLLHAAKLDDGTITPNLQRVNITTLLSDAAAELQSFAKDKKISCTIVVPKEPITVLIDPILFHIVLQNLFSNAVKYSKEGGHISMECQWGKTYFEVTVKDTGIGVPKEEQHRIFERLFRASNAMNMDTDGNGLGLFISKMIVENLGGKIAFQSTQNKGATFTVRFPRKTKRSHKS